MKAPKYFIYSDSEGNISKRKLDKLVEEDDIYFKGFQEDGGFRTFRKDRVIEVLTADEYLSANLSTSTTHLRTTDFDSYLDTDSSSNVDLSISSTNTVEVFFYGFLRKKYFRIHCEVMGFRVSTRIRPTTTILVHDGLIGWITRWKAKKHSVRILTVKQYFEFADTGVLPD
ncbi:hypothetical protein AAEX37_00996 [Oligella sp. MSHR50489EDL]|uniref:hypothetical protein n=1 Tax=Oligella sp. MSHR50489EDL TaxID=3139409 RepID=UPI003D8163BA